MKYYLVWVIFLGLVVGVAQFISSKTADDFAESTGKSMIVDLSMDAIDDFECGNMEKSMCTAVSQMSFLAYTSEGAKRYRQLLKDNPTPREWDKVTAIAIEKSYQDAVSRAGGTAPAFRMSVIKKHYKLLDILFYGQMVYAGISFVVVTVFYRRAKRKV
tara:strand:- start:1421 stop:1897 length:477 start_codon:yes stop_codon:yes gene_type:complete